MNVLAVCLSWMSWQDVLEFCLGKMSLQAERFGDERVVLAVCLGWMSWQAVLVGLIGRLSW